MSAIDDLEDSLSSVRALIVLESKYEDPPKPDDRPTAFALRGACALLTVASFEQFLKTLFEEELDRIVTEKIGLSRLPEGLRTAAYYNSLEHAMKGDHDTRTRSERLSDIHRAASAVAADSFVPRSLSRTNSNPDANCLKRLFKQSGMSDAMPAIQRSYVAAIGGAAIATSFVEDKINSLVAARNVVAHTANAAHIARTELVANIDFVHNLAIGIRNLLRSHIDQLISDATSS